MDPDLVLAAADAGVLTLTLNRPERLNAWTPEMEARYFELLERADADPDVRAIVVTGAGRGFCAGADMEVLQRIGAGDGHYESPRSMAFPLSVRKPLIAAVNGACAGLGLVQALFCDVRVVASTAKLTTAFAQRGLVAEYGLSWLLSRAAGPGRALDLLLSARVVSGDEAVAMGLAEFAAPAEDVLATAQAYAAGLASASSPRSMAAMKEQVRRDLDGDFQTAFDRATGFMAESFTWPDLAEGVASFLEPRPPAFAPLPRR